MSSNKQNIYIYRDDGADVFSVSCLYSELSSDLKNTDKKIRFISAKDIINGKLEDAVALFIGGGRDEPYATKLNGKGNDAIRKFVENGGSYVGICAGAYYACNQIEYKKGDVKEIVKTRELSFFNGLGKGPLNCFDNEVKAETFPSSVIKLNLNKQESIAYYQEGPKFVINNNFKGKTLAYYSHNNGEKSSAIIACNVGKGKVVLSGVHPEISGKNFELALNHHYKNIKLPKKFISYFKKHEYLRKKLWHDVLNEAGLKNDMHMLIRAKSGHSK